MAFGRHWEWRGFGPLAPEMLARIRSLPALFPRPQAVLDRYLWTPGCPLNLKLRFGDFKIKRRLASEDDGLEEWLEDPRENYAFPLPREVFPEIARELGAESPVELAEDLPDEESWLATLARVVPRLEVVAVEKLRWQFTVPDGGAAVVELAEISAPERVLSVGVEDESAARVRATLDALELPGGLRPMSYLDAIEDWACGRRVAPV